MGKNRNMKALNYWFIKFFIILINYSNFASAKIKCYEGFCLNYFFCYEIILNFLGEGLDKRDWDKKDCNDSQWCIKLADSDNTNEYR